MEKKHDKVSLDQKVHMVIQTIEADASQFRGSPDWIKYWGGDTEMGLISLKMKVAIVTCVWCPRLKMVTLVWG